MQPMQQVMSEAENILATEPKVGFNIGQAKEELIKVNVCASTVDLLRCFLLVLQPKSLNHISLFVSLPTEND